MRIFLILSIVSCAPAATEITQAAWTHVDPNPFPFFLGGDLSYVHEEEEVKAPKRRKGHGHAVQEVSSKQPPMTIEDKLFDPHPYPYNMDVTHHDLTYHLHDNDEVEVKNKAKQHSMKRSGDDKTQEVSSMVKNVHHDHYQHHHHYDKVESADETSESRLFSAPCSFVLFLFHDD
jgi:hypothetical protein